MTRTEIARRVAAMRAQGMPERMIDAALKDERDAIPTNSEAQAERAGFDSLSADRQEALAANARAAARKVRIQENGEKLVDALRNLLAESPGCRTEARCLLARIEGE